LFANVTHRLAIVLVLGKHAHLVTDG